MLEIEDVRSQESLEIMGTDLRHALLPTRADAAFDPIAQHDHRQPDDERRGYGEATFQALRSPASPQAIEERCRLWSVSGWTQGRGGGSVFGRCFFLDLSIYRAWHRSGILMINEWLKRGGVVVIAH
ncbi:MAG: hypothetical protein J0I42_06125 [Bosea sp.]|uniref:hypothetical protein n=1 Tax=Bosea sp. (in: a-proteobacteria) TaxID=1871050 RepID=UPI001AC05121|nr:hypothetical protein [Bosea sp. (in: a-proteobacteria)]MBN9451512.1 hypothetical protein [Bosea sp. (in: a-proteobacteria)]